METISGKYTKHIDALEFQQKISGYDGIWLDIGTGDGKYVIRTARSFSKIFVIGIDSCRENLIQASRCAPANTLFVIANALALPVLLKSQASRLSIHFPWGSLLTGLLDADPGLLDGLRAVTQPGAVFDVHLNSSALAEAGWSLEAGAAQVQAVLQSAGFHVKPLVRLNATDLKSCQTTWAHRLAYGRAPAGMLVKGAWKG